MAVHACTNVEHLNVCSCGLHVCVEVHVFVYTPRLLETSELTFHSGMEAKQFQLLQKPYLCFLPLKDALSLKVSVCLLFSLNLQFIYNIINLV